MIDDQAKTEILQAIAALDIKFTGRIDGLEKRSDGLDARFDGLEKQYDGLDARFDGLEKQYDGLDARFDGLEKKMDALHEEAMDAIQMLSSSTDQQFNELDVKIDGVEERLNAKIDRTRAEMPTKDYIDRKFADYDKDASERAERTFVRR